MKLNRPVGSDFASFTARRQDSECARKETTGFSREDAREKMQSKRCWIADTERKVLEMRHWTDNTGQSGIPEVTIEKLVEDKSTFIISSIFIILV